MAYIDEATVLNHRLELDSEYRITEPAPIARWAKGLRLKRFVEWCRSKYGIQVRYEIREG